MLVSVHHPRYKALRAALVALRNTAGLTQMQLAQRLEVGQSYVSKIERGDAYVDVMLFADWCRACGVNPAQTLDQVMREAQTGLTYRVDSMGVSAQSNRFHHRGAVA